MFLLDRRQLVLVSDCYCLTGGRVVWEFSFRRNLSDSEVSDFILMLGMIEKVFISFGKLDVK